MIRADVKVHFRGKHVKQRGVDFCEDLVLGLALEIEKRAKENVSPGVGPGPHPHRTEHEDTGALRDAIKADVDVVGQQAVASVVVEGFPGEYGTYLEVGWRNVHTGNFWRYPWLWPAVQASRPLYPPMAAHKARVHFRGSGLHAVRPGLPAVMGGLRIPIR